MKEKKAAESLLSTSLRLWDLKHKMKNETLREIELELDKLVNEYPHLIGRYLRHLRDAEYKSMKAANKARRYRIIHLRDPLRSKRSSAISMERRFVAFMSEQQNTHIDVLIEMNAECTKRFKAEISKAVAAAKVFGSKNRNGALITSAALKLEEDLGSFSCKLSLKTLSRIVKFQAAIQELKRMFGRFETPGETKSRFETLEETEKQMDALAAAVAVLEQEYGRVFAPKTESGSSRLMDFDILFRLTNKQAKDRGLDLLERDCFIRKLRTSPFKYALQPGGGNVKELCHQKAVELAWPRYWRPELKPPSFP